MSRLGPAPDADRAAVQALSPVALKYDTPIDRESAYEILTGREAIAAKEKDALKRAEAAEAEAARARKEASQGCRRQPHAGLDTRVRRPVLRCPAQVHAPDPDRGGAEHLHAHR